MDPRNERIVARSVAFLVLLSTLLAPLITAVISILVLAVLGIYRLVSREK